MKKRPVLYSELCYLIGIISLALGAALMVKANFGMSVVVSPSYMLYLKLSQIWPAFSFGMSEYIVQSALLVLLILLVRRFHWSYLFSFATALLYGFILDRCMALLENVPIETMASRLPVYGIGLFFCALGVSLVLHTYISPEVYELLIRELSARYRWKLGVVKTIYDCTSCLTAITLSFCFYGLFQFHGVGLGTVVSALSSGTLVTLIGRFLEKHVTLRSAFPSLEGYFTPPPFGNKVPSEQANSQ